MEPVTTFCLTFSLKGENETRKVWLNGKELLPDKSQKIRNHSPGGFCWGYGGSGPAQLALAVLLELFGKEVALRNYQNFKTEIISSIPIDKDFELKITIKIPIRTLTSLTALRIN